MQTTFVNRQNTNAVIYSHANLIANITDPNKKIGPLSDYVDNQAVKLIADILKSDNSDPRRQVCFNPDTGTIVRTEKLRQYGPRVHWLNQTIQRIWDRFELWRNLGLEEHTPFQERDIEHGDTLMLAAKHGMLDGWQDIGDWERKRTNQGIIFRPHNTHQNTQQ